MCAQRGKEKGAIVIMNSDKVKKFLFGTIVVVAIAAVSAVAYTSLTGDNLGPGEVQWAFDVSDDRKLVGWADSVFFGQVREKVGETNTGEFTETQFKVKVLEALKGSVNGTVIVSKTQYDGQTPMSFNDESLKPGKSYLFITNTNSEKRGHMIGAYDSTLIELRVPKHADKEEVLNSQHAEKLRERFTEAIENQIDPFPNEPSGGEIVHNPSVNVYAVSTGQSSRIFDQFIAEIENNNFPPNDGSEHVNSLKVVRKNSPVDVSEVKEGAIVAFDSKWVQANVDNSKFHGFLKNAASKRIGLVAIGGDTSKLFRALHLAGVHKFGRENKDSGNFIYRNPAHNDPPMVGYKLMDDGEHTYPSILISNSREIDELVEALRSW
ncbi:hypothetical protein AKJ63_00640 [candidate division MSBL1 archaeon SCGC-AAA259D18]|uniref:Uncharacterized protein n=2 Tax=candidate division MSBL1 TaxID=215777 RepID=A0A133UBL7_9EURY|nr:hypothetical protein AKJ57_00700 [candidate division MSBL1 archaeon SCGC-AAA259A05]KXA91848.1 hypothetical protein AKJ63_00640 [candidate division MSBL1 archaeon SCGC-AAA259D18]